jgi:hypothetical protein
MGELRFSVALLISVTSEEAVLKLKFFGIRHSGQSASGCQRANGTKIGNEMLELLERKLRKTRRNW